MVWACWYCYSGAVTSVDYSLMAPCCSPPHACRLQFGERSTKQILFVQPTTNSKFAKFSTHSPSTYIAISSDNSDITIISAVSPFGSIQTFNAGHGGALAAQYGLRLSYYAGDMRGNEQQTTDLGYQCKSSNNVLRHNSSSNFHMCCIVREQPK